MPRIANAWVLRSKSDPTTAWNSKGGALPQLYTSKGRAANAVEHIKGLAEAYEPLEVRLVPAERLYVAISALDDALDELAGTPLAERIALARAGLLT